MTNEKPKEMHEMPDFNDEELWKELNQKLWFLVKEAAASKFAGNQLPGFFDEFAEEAVKTVAVKDSRKKECLTFARCEEAAEMPGTLTTSEKAHLLDCQYCARRISAYSELAIPQTVGVPAEAANSRAGEARNLLVKWFEPIIVAFTNSPTIKLSFAGIVLVIGIIGFFILRNSPDSPDRVNLQPPVTKPEVIHKNGDESNTALPDSTNPTADSENSTSQAKKEDLAANQREAKTPDETEGVPLSELDGVVAALNSKNYKMPDSEIVRLFQESPVTRGGANEAQKIKPLRPVNRTVMESNPTLIWEGGVDSEFTVTVKNRNGTREVTSESLQQTSWQVSEPLPTGAYFWTVTAKIKDSEKPFESSKMMFYVVSGKEKKDLEKVRSRLAKAAIYFKYGLLDEAEQELEAELNEPGKSPRAEGFLQQVRREKQKIKDQENKP